MHYDNGGSLDRLRRSYDAVAAAYIRANVPGLAERHPLERAMLDAFAELVREGRSVADLGCGPGDVTAYLYERGADVFGVDLSPVLIAEARRVHPELTFEVGSLTDVDRPDGSLDGIVAIYSIIHLPLDLLPQVFERFSRLLAPGGHLLLGFQVRAEPAELTRWFDQDVELSYPVLDPDRVTGLLVDAGLELRARLWREPDDVHETLPRVHLLAARAHVSGRR